MKKYIYFILLILILSILIYNSYHYLKLDKINNTFCSEWEYVDNPIITPLNDLYNYSIYCKNSIYELKYNVKTKTSEFKYKKGVYVLIDELNEFFS